MQFLNYSIFILHLAVRVFSLQETCRQNNTVALTFDDGPYTGITENILDVLKKEKLKATFFVCGKQLEFQKNVEILKRADKEGHIIASHTYNHPDLTTLSDAQIIKEMNDTSNTIKAAINKRPKLMRPPYGKINDRARALLVAMGYQIVGWNIDSNDWDCNKSTQKIQQDVIAQMGPGKSGILLMHDLRKNTYEALPAIIKAFRNNKNRIVQLDKCIDAKEVYFRDYTRRNEKIVQIPINNPEGCVDPELANQLTNPATNGVEKVMQGKIMLTVGLIFCISFAVGLF